MATSIEFVGKVCAALSTLGEVRYRKMFGEYMVYVDEKPVCLVCDNRAFVKILPELADIMRDVPRGFPYQGAREHYELDVENLSLVRAVIPILLAHTPVPQPKKRRPKDVPLP